jgi:hypothetical protein
MKKLNLPDENVDQEFQEFWRSFRMFPSRMGRFVFSHSLSLIGLAVLPYLVMIVGSLIADVSYGTEWKWTTTSLQEWQEIVLVIGFISAIVPFLRWQSRIPVTFQWLLETHRMSSRGAKLKEEYLKYLEEYQQTLLTSKLRYSFVILFCLLVIAFNLIAGTPQLILYYISGGLQQELIYAFGLFTVWIFGFLLWAYLSGLAAWLVFVTGRQISRLSEHFDINIQPSHPDGCGGLKLLGDFCFSMTLPIVLGGVVLALFGIGGIVLKGIHIGSIDFREIMPQTILFADIGLFVAFLPLIMFAFFSPLWNIHRVMVECRRKAEDEFSSQVIRLEQQIRSYVEEDKVWEKARIAKERLEILQAVNPNKTGYPVWPFRKTILLALFSPQLLGIVSTLISTYQAFIAVVSQ